MRFQKFAGLTVPALVVSTLFGQGTTTQVQTQAVQQEQGAQEQRFIEHVKFLASPELEGRGAGTAGLGKAATYIADQFKKAGLQPAGSKSAFTQNFTLNTGAEAGPNNRVSRNGKALKYDSDFRPISFSSNGKIEGPVVFAGYGITAPELNYDDYAHLDVKNKVVLVLRYEPESFVKGKEEKQTFHAHLANKAINARNRGAAAIILVNADPGGKADDLTQFGRISGPEDVGIPFLHVKREVAEQWLNGTTLKELQEKIETSRKPASFQLPDTKLSVQVDITRKQATVQNILGYLPGRSKEYIVIGAHYDHIGYGHQNSMSPSLAGQIHPGADDNASGTAALIELARIFSQRRTELDRGILFAAFAGEELGLLGSARWLKEPTLDIANAVAMLNMDMIGRINGSKLYVGGIGSGSTFDAILKAAAEKYDFTVDRSFQGTSSSDHASFVAKSIPALFFFSGLHRDYHKPSDTVDKLNTAASAKVVNLIADVAKGLVADKARPQFARVKSTGSHGGSEGASSGGGGGGGYGPYFGVVPDFAPLEKGVLFADISPGSPAEAAGLKGGDILISFGDKPIRDLYDFTFALRASKAGDLVQVKILRNNKEMTIPVTLAERK